MKNKLCLYKIGYDIETLQPQYCFYYFYNQIYHHHFK